VQLLRTCNWKYSYFCSSHCKTARNMGQSAAVQETYHWSSLVPQHCRL